MHVVRGVISDLMIFFSRFCATALLGMFSFQNITMYSVCMLCFNGMYFSSQFFVLASTIRIPGYEIGVFHVFFSSMIFSQQFPPCNKNGSYNISLQERSFPLFVSPFETKNLHQRENARSFPNAASPSIILEMQTEPAAISASEKALRERQFFEPHFRPESHHQPTIPEQKEVNPPK